MVPEADANRAHPQVPPQPRTSHDLAGLMDVHAGAWDEPTEMRSASKLVPPQDAPTGRFFLAGLKAGIVLVLVWGLFFNFSEVRGSSMMPGIHDRDRILVDHVSYLFTKPDRGDIVVLRYPKNPTLDYIKRVVAVPGDIVEIRAGTVWVNHIAIVEGYVDQSSLDPAGYPPTVVKPEHCFVLGDNRIRSSDSREFGQVPYENLRGKVRVRLWPLGRLGLLE
ncbi:MAG: signal peptidase I [bacterium]|nr:signal peptidase I [bacterium]